MWLRDWELEWKLRTRNIKSFSLKKEHKLKEREKLQGPLYFEMDLDELFDFNDVLLDEPGAQLCEWSKPNIIVGQKMVHVSKLVITGVFQESFSNLLLLSAQIEYSWKNEFLKANFWATTPGF